MAGITPTGNRAFDAAALAAQQALQSTLAQSGLTQPVVTTAYVAYYQSLSAAARNAQFWWIYNECQIAIAIARGQYPSPPLPN